MRGVVGGGTEEPMTYSDLSLQEQADDLDAVIKGLNEDILTSKTRLRLLETRREEVMIRRIAVHDALVGKVSEPQID